MKKKLLWIVTALLMLTSHCWAWDGQTENHIHESYFTHDDYTNQQHTGVDLIPRGQEKNDSEAAEEEARRQAEDEARRQAEEEERRREAEARQAAAVETLMEEAAAEETKAEKEAMSVPDLAVFKQFEQDLNEVNRQIEEATKKVAAGGSVIEVGMAMAEKILSQYRKEQILRKAGDPVTLFTGEYSESTVDMLITSNILQFPIIRSYRSNNRITGSFGYGWISSLDQRLLIGETPDAQVRVAELRQAYEEHKKLISQIRASFADSYGTSDISSAKTILEERRTAATNAYSHAKTAVQKATSAKKSALSYQKTRANSAFSNAEAAEKRYADLVKQYEKALAAVDGDTAAIFKLESVGASLQDELHFLEDQIAYFAPLIEKNSSARFPGTPEHWYTTGFDTITLITAEGYPVLFRPSAASVWTPAQPVTDAGGSGYTALVRHTDSTFTLTHRNGTVQVYDGAGFLVSETDRNGNAIQIQRDAATNQVQFITASTGERWNFLWNDNGTLDCLFSSEDATNAVTWKYRGLLLESVTDADEYTTRYQYDDNRVLTAVHKADGSSIRQKHDYTADGNCRITATTNEEGFSEFFSYDDVTQTTVYTDHDGTVTRYTFDDTGNLIRMETGTGIIQVNTWSPQGLLLESTTNGRTVAYGYSGTGDPIYARYSDDTSERWNWDSWGNLIRHTDRTGSTEEAEYDGCGNLILLKKQGKNFQQRLYDQYGRVIQITEPGAPRTTTTYRWDQKGNLLQKTAGGVTTSYTWDTRRRLTSIAIQGTVIEKRQYTPRTITVQKDNGLVSVYTYNERHDLTSLSATDSVTGENRTTHWTWDRRHLPLTETHNDIPATACRYTPEGKLSACLYYDPHKSHITTVQWNGAVPVKRCIFTVDGVDNAALYEGKANWNTVSLDYLMKRAAERGELYEYTCIPLPENQISEYLTEPPEAVPLQTALWENTDERGRLARVVIGPENSIATAVYYEEYQYSKDGRSVTQILGGEVFTTWELNAFGEITAKTDGMGNKTTVRRNFAGLPTVTTAPNGFETQMEFNRQGYLTGITAANGESIRIGYDPLGNMTSIANPMGMEWRGTWNASSRLIYEEEFPGKTTAYTWNSVQDLESMYINGKAVDISRYFASNDAIKEFLNPASGLSYNLLGNVTEGITADSHLKWEWNKAGLLVLQTDLLTGTTIRYTYDRAGRRESMTTVQNGVTLSSVRYTRDAAGNTTAITDTVQNMSITCSYDEQNRETERKFSNGTTVRTIYDQAGRIAATSSFNSQGILLQAEAAAYDQMSGRKTAVITDKGDCTLYNYDEQGRLQSIWTTLAAADYPRYHSVAVLKTIPLSEAAILKETLNRIQITLGNSVPTALLMLKETYEYDDRGNRIKKNSCQGTVCFQYDENDHLLSESAEDGVADTRYQWDSQGNLLKRTSADQEETYQYNSENRMMQSSIRNLQTGETLTQQYTYDALGRRNSCTTGITTVRYTYDGVSFAIIGETETVTPTTGSRYRWLGASDSSVTRTSRMYLNGSPAAESQGPEKQYYSTDSYGSITLVTDTYGRIKAEKTYTPFGVPRS